MQAVALRCWHEVGPFVSSSSAAPMIMHGDEDQQRKQHCSHNMRDYASTGVLCGRHGSPGRMGRSAAQMVDDTTTHFTLAQLPQKSCLARTTRRHSGGYFDQGMRLRKTSVSGILRRNI